MRTLPSPALLLAAAALVSLAGCKNMEKPVLARTDAQLAGDIQSKLSGDKTFSTPDSPDVHVAVTNGVATLSGETPDSNVRLQAATDASQVAGVKEVVNDIALPTTETADACVPPAPAHHASLHLHRRHERAPEMASAYVPPAPEPIAPPPAPAYVPQPDCNCGPVAVPAPVVVPARPAIYGYGYGPAIGVGIYARPGFVGRGYGYARPYGFRGGFRGGARFYGRR
jgi:hypothetical protein